MKAATLFGTIGCALACWSYRAPAQPSPTISEVPEIRREINQLRQDYQNLHNGFTCGLQMETWW